jgi:glycosyltransferase involved in cell wall biosynthesis
MMTDLTVLILTFNEEIHIKRCLESISSIAKRIIIVDSYSTDKTVDLSKSLGADVYKNKWINYAEQFNWGLKNTNIDTKWVMRLDADEYLTVELQEEIIEKIDKIDKNTTAVYMKRRVFFMDKWIKRGGYYPIWMLRIWHLEKGYCENKWMDEHIKVESGNTVFFQNDLVDHNLNSLTWWIQKHNKYADREMIDLLNILYNFLNYKEVEPAFFGSQEKRKRYLKIKYAKLPLFIRPFIYFSYRYFIKLGFLDGTRGLIWHFLQGFWYRFLVDAKIFEIKRQNKKPSEIKEALEKYTGHKLESKN